MIYKIIDVCENPSNAIYAEELDKPLTFERWMELLKLEIISYCYCYYYPANPKEMKEMIQSQFIQNLTEALSGKNICINGMEFIREEGDLYENRLSN